LSGHPEASLLKYLSFNDLGRNYTHSMNKNEEKMKAKMEKYETGCY
jgi:hypothetical protein